MCIPPSASAVHSNLTFLSYILSMKFQSIYLKNLKASNSKPLKNNWKNQKQFSV